MSTLGIQLVLGISDSTTKVVLIAIFALGMVAVAIVPFVVDVVNAHISWRKILKKDPKALDKLPRPVGLQGLYRATMAIALIVAISFGLGYILVEKPFKNNSSI